VSEINELLIENRVVIQRLNNWFGLGRWIFGDKIQDNACDSALLQRDQDPDADNDLVF
jgi:hypothetical protein